KPPQAHTHTYTQRRNEHFNKGGGKEQQHEEMCTVLPTMSLLLATPTPSSTSLFSLASPSPSSSPSPPSSSCIVDFSSKSLRTPNPSLNHSCPSKRKNLPLSKATWLCGHSRRDQDLDNWTAEEVNVARRFGSDDDTGNPIPMQIQSTVEGVGTTAVVKEFKASPDVDYLQACDILHCVLIIQLRPLLD
ncbi:hypothetical protein Tsubulata_045269, partial [Turnera subulata]